MLFYFFCLHCCLINIHIFDYPDSRLSGLFTEVPTSPDNRGSTVVDLHEGEANLSFHVSNMKSANNLFNIEEQQFGHFLRD